MSSKMRVMILAAGLGTRLRPLTDHLPKPLVPILGKPMITYVLERIEKYGYTEAMVNIHYLPDLMRKFIEEWNCSKNKLKITIQDETDKLLDSGGAIKKAGTWLFENHDHALICNADVIAYPDFSALETTHLQLFSQDKVECTMTVMKHPDAGVKYNGLRVRKQKVIAFDKPGVPDPELFHFPGYYVLYKGVLQRMPKHRDGFSIRDDLWIPLIKESKLGAWVYDGDYFDVGTPDDLRAAEQVLRLRSGD